MTAENPEAIAYQEAVEAARSNAAPDAGDLLDSIVGVIRRFVVLNDEQYDVLALWVLHAYAIEAADTTPYLAITSPEKRSGKSRLMEVLAQLVPRPMEAANISDAALFRALGQDLPVTLLFDEIDTVFGKKTAGTKEELRGLINAGYRRGAVAWRCVGEGKNQEVAAFPVFGPKALAGIGELPDTIADRCIPIRLRRKLPDEKAERGRFKAIRAAAVPIGRPAAEWTDAVVEKLKEAEPSIPDELDDRAADGAEPLLAIADLAGDEWAGRARASIIALHKQKTNDESSWGVQLLAAIQVAFEDEDRLSTADVLTKLKEDPEEPWASWGKSGLGLDARALGRLLKPFGIHSKGVRLESGKTPKGFHREQFQEAWNRYLAPGTPHLSATSATLALGSQKTELSIRNAGGSVADSEQGSNPHSNADVADVADREAYRGEIATPEQEAEIEETAAKFGAAI